MQAEQAAFPYRAVVLEDEAPIQSGPEQGFYATDRLVKGAQVEVYRVDNSDWLAIRPPQDSFSWVAAENVELTASGTRVRVINTPAKTRVGSKFSDAHDVEYISLELGEVLELFGTKSGNPRLAALSLTSENQANPNFIFSSKILSYRKY